jgi:hypothetical protein
MQTVNTNLDKDKSSEGQAPFQATQVQTTMKLYERIQGYIFRLMATDSVPRVRPPSSVREEPQQGPLSLLRIYAD